MNVVLQLGATQARLDAINNRVYAGRDPTVCGLAFLDAGLSRRHAEIWVEQGQTWIRDLGSSNGTWIDGQLLGAYPAALRPGQQVYLGTVALAASWEGGGAMTAVAMPPALAQMVNMRQQAIAAGHTPPPMPMVSPQQAAAMMNNTPIVGSSLNARPATPGPLPADYSYRRQGSNNNGVLLIALKQDTFFNENVIEGFIEFTALDNENVASITVELVEQHEDGPRGGHIWDRVLVRQGPWKAMNGDVLPLPFQLRVPGGVSSSGRETFWELRGMVDINWASDVDCQLAVTMRNTDLERIRDALGALDYRIADMRSEAHAQRFDGRFNPPAQKQRELGINEVKLGIEYLGTNLKVYMRLDKKGRDREVANMFDLPSFRAASVPEISQTFAQMIDGIMNR